MPNDFPTTADERTAMLAAAPPVYLDVTSVANLLKAVIDNDDEHTAAQLERAVEQHCRGILTDEDLIERFVELV